MTNEMTIWSHVTERLKSTFPEDVYRTWFSQLTLRKLAPDKALLEVPNKFIADWIYENYLHELKQIFHTIIKESPEIQIIPINKSSKKIYKHQDKKKSIQPGKKYLNSSMTFDKFVTGECNRFAYTSALKVANKPSNNTYSPLYMYSHSSFGKTHLLNAIGNHINEKEPNRNIKYISSKSFYSDFNNFIKTKSIHSFLEKYISLNVLLFDDIQFLSNKKRLQEEFISLFDHFYGEKRQIVISADKPPNRLKNFSSHITSRLGSGLITEIKPPNDDIKINIIKNNLTNKNINISNDIILYLSKYSNNFKTLIKNSIRIETYMSMNNGNINLSMVKSLVKSNHKITVKDVQSITSGYFNISTSELLSSKKKRKYSYPRHIAMYLCKKNMDLSYKDIGSRFGDRDHSTVIYAIRQIEKNSLLNKDIRNDISNLNRLLI